MLVERMMPRKLRGFTLTEAAIVLGIVGLILGAIWVAAAAVYNNLRVTTTSNQILQIVQSVRSMHATQTTVDSGITGSLVAMAGGMPKDTLQVSGTNTPTNVWGGAINVTAFTSSGGIADDAFTVTYSSVPVSACIDLLVRNTGVNRDTGLIGAGSTASNSTTFPVTISTASGQCSGGTLAFTFRLKG